LRTPREIAFRLKQEIANLLLWRFPPSLSTVPPPPKFPPSIERLPLNPLPAEILRLADQILHHRFPIFGAILETGPDIRWRRDYLRGIETGTPYFRLIPYLDLTRAGDHKYIWELNRHQHLVLLAQAYRLTQRAEYLREAQTQIIHWLAENPPLRGINWTSALEVAFRALSWVWLDALVGAALPDDFRRPSLNALYLHGCFLERNLSTYFSPNTHLLGEAVALHTLGALYPAFPRGLRWQSLGHKLVEQQMESQVHEDGSHFEQSTYYHAYAHDMFLWHDLLADTSPTYKDKLLRMTAYLDALMGPTETIPPHTIPLIGDDDGGRFFPLYAPRHASSRQDRSSLFPDAGMVVMAARDLQIVVKAGGFGPGSAGHSHSDALSFVCRRGADWLLVDSGTYTYLDPQWRNPFRGSAAHNTIRIDNQDQATPIGPFRWAGRPDVRILQWSSTDERDLLNAECRYSGFVHRRRFLFLKPNVLFILDQVEGPAGEHLVEQFWHAAHADTFAQMVFSHKSEAIETWHSTVFGSKYPATARLIAYRGRLPLILAAAISFQTPPDHLAIEAESGLLLHLQDGTILRAQF
jgi:hypothetical protein